MTAHPDGRRTTGPHHADLLTIGQLADRSGLAASALRYYESLGLIHATRTSGGQRRYTRGTLRRIAFIRAAQRVGLSLDEAKVALDRLPERPAPSGTEWDRVAESWQSRIDEQIAELELLKLKLSGCIGCGCLSLSRCALYNAGDRAGEAGPGARYLLTRDPADGPEPVSPAADACGSRLPGR
ncbi:MerR family redox-sensitive transcriptional activator SoxR [Streptomyces sp. 1114.5]|uniref:redox-sensitive transcriptional activator SoxR n=1 Tax=unclassified Streptomyces TaxID=2593676 RepID=UPI000BD37FF6|nr:MULTISPECIES: redox-sensitive transcriptional activator SoxR [unclassified Streptomyces]RKT18549.1 MerR family redox-sensitive transcriptional activator SoxR [Streptomyces sp. 1114.5]SOB84751.1 MerR family transcriptional regulator, redox-sensitive transcriptional activator SoxR [Streptomyces sp. 1331.2]